MPVNPAQKATGAASAARVERDPLGEVRVPAEAYWGAQTQRAVENFPISGITAPADLVTATVLIKQASAQANGELGRLDRAVAGAISAAADDILNGRYRDQFIVDVYQAGAGTSHNMNTNEVLANLAAERLGEPRGSYKTVHPNDHVNMGQSTNDVFPAATRLAILLGVACTPGGSLRAGRRARRESARVRARAENRTNASSGCRPDYAGPGVRRLRGQRSSCGGRTEAQR